MTQIMLDGALRNLSGPLADFAQKLSGPDGNRKWLPAFKRFLREENPWDGKPLFTPWKTITAEPVDFGHVCQTLREEGFVIVDYNPSVFAAITKQGIKERVEFDLIEITPAEVGLLDGGHYLTILRRIRAFGLAPCPPEVAVALRRQYDEQPFESYVELLMDPIQVGTERYSLDLHHRDTGEMTLGAYGIEDNLPGSDAPFVCILPRT